MKFKHTNESKLKCHTKERALVHQNKVNKLTNEQKYCVVKNIGKAQ